MTQIQVSIQKCIGQIIQQNPFIKNVFDEIHQQGGQVLVVGGAVRDCLLDQFGSDLDFEVYHLSFQQLENILQTFGTVSFVGKSFGVLRLHRLDADWSIPRKDSSGRKPIVEFDPDMSFEQAFKRRDLTVNAMGIDVQTLELKDPYAGLEDLENRVLRAPDIEFFVQDPLRLFRVMQFCARLNMNPDEALDKACQNIDISKVSLERIEDEFKKLFLKAEQPSRGLRWLQSIDRLEALFPNVLFDQPLFVALDYLAGQAVSDKQKLFGMWGFITMGLQDAIFDQFTINQPITRDQSKTLKSFVKQYVHSSEAVQGAMLVAWYVRYVPELIKVDNLANYKWLAYWLDPQLNLELLGKFASCWYSSEIVDQFEQQAKEAGVLLQPEQPLITGKDLLNIAQGKQLGDLVKKAYQIQINQKILDQKALFNIIILVDK